MRRSIAAAATFLAVGALAATATPAVAADGSPCGPQFRHNNGWHVQNCPDWSPNNWIPVFADHRVGARQVGSIYAPGNDWYVCQGRYAGQTYGIFYGGANLQNDWWAYTMADNGQFGYVPEVYFQGGRNFEPDATLSTICWWG
jgi:hypothetical protein